MREVFVLMRAFMMPSSERKLGTVAGSTYSIHRSNMTTSEMEREKKNLTIQSRSSFGAPPPPFSAWFETDTHFHMPRFYGLQRFGAPSTDERCTGDAIALSFEGQLTNVQERATNAAFSRFLCDSGPGGCMVCLPCGYGKTVWAVNALCKLGRKACILVHKGVIRDQWKLAFERFCPGVRVGLMQGKTWQVEGCDVVIAMVMTLAKRAYDTDVLQCFGVVVADECHHLAAPIMSMALRSFRARYVIGLTATKDRPDGLTPLLHWSLGEVAYKAERVDEKARISIALFSGATEQVCSRDGKPMTWRMLNILAQNPRRNAFIADHIARYLKSGRVILVFVHRLVQIDLLRTLLLARGISDASVGVFKSGMSKPVYEEHIGRKVVLCSYGMADEGLDKTEADTCIMASPKTRVEQCIGRVQRPCATKQSPLVLDVVDDVPTFEHQRWARQRHYNKRGYEVQVVECSGHPPDDTSWFS